jgi:hypothetical protein
MSELAADAAPPFLDNEKELTSCRMAERALKVLTVGADECTVSSWRRKAHRAVVRVVDAEPPEPAVQDHPVRRRIQQRELTNEIAFFKQPPARALATAEPSLQIACFNHWVNVSNSDWHEAGVLLSYSPKVAKNGFSKTST